MVLIRILRFLAGYIKISVAGKFPERFLNLIASHGCHIWNTHRRGDKIECCIFVNEYKRIRHFRKSCGVRPRVVQRYGLPFICRKYCKRAGLVAGAAVFAVILNLMPKFVWGINISGNSVLTDSQVVAAANEAGIKIGTPISKINADDMRLKIAIDLPEISWAAVNVCGAYVNIDVREATDRVEQDERYCNTIASYDGRITAIYARKGAAAVKVGDAVVKGNLLVSGAVEYNDGRTVFCHSDADVIAETNRSYTVKIPYNQEKKVYTGKKIKRKVFGFLGCNIPLYVGSVGKNYTGTLNESPLVIGDVTLPVTIYTGTFSEFTVSKYKLNYNRAYKQGLEAFSKYEKSLDNVKIIKRDVTCKREKDGVEMTASYVCSENIAKTEYFSVEMQ